MSVLLKTAILLIICIIISSARIKNQKSLNRCEIFVERCKNEIKEWKECKARCGLNWISDNLYNQCVNACDHTSLISCAERDKCLTQNNS